MKKMFALFLSFLTLLTLWVEAGSSIVADTIQDEYRAAMLRWQQQLSIASSSQQRQAIIQLRPNALEYCDRLKAQIRGESQHAWTLKHQAFLLENDSRITEDDEVALIEWAKRNHIEAKDIGRFCMALVVARPSQGIAHHQKVQLAQKIGENHPDKAEQGLGALAHCILLGSLGENKKVLSERLRLVKRAIMQVGNIEINGVPAIRYAEAEVFKITKLTRGRVAPNIEGVDVSNVPFQLYDSRGKTTMLLFWNSQDPESKEVLDFGRKVTAKRIAEPFVLVGVNSDSRENLGLLKVDREVTWRNFSDPEQRIFQQYYIPKTPWCMILDKQGRVAYTGAPGAFADFAVDALSEVK